MALSLTRLLEQTSALAIEAGRRIRGYHGQNFTHNLKADDSPVTEADHEAHRIIVTSLALLTPDIPIISEESTSHPSISAARYFWLVDPLDGTRSFLRGGQNFTVNIALIEDDSPIMGVIHHPMSDVLYTGVAGQGATKQEGDAGSSAIHTRPIPMEGMKVLTGSRQTEQETLRYLSTLKVAERDAMASSIKFCRLAEGVADMYPRFGPTMEWDTAAGQAILEAAGGRVTTAEGVPFTYRKPLFKNGFFIAFGH